MTLAMLVAILLVVAVMLSIWRRRDRRWFTVLLQLLAAVLLYLCLCPPTAMQTFTVDELLVLTPGVTATQLTRLPPLTPTVALPGVSASRDITQMPDLGTALRSHPEVRRLRIIGGGLPARDRDAARGIAIRFDAAPLPQGLVALDVPTSVLAGHRWRLHGRVEGIDAGQVELRDPAGVVQATQRVGADGRFVLATTARTEGQAVFTLQVRDADGQRIDSASVPLVTRPGAALRVLLLAAAPDPELKYLRRWAVDAGLQLKSRLMLSDGVALTEGPSDQNTEIFDDLDLVILDQRVWLTLHDEQKQHLREALDGGLGVLLRMSGDVPEAVLSDWVALGFPIRSSGSVDAVSLSRLFGLDETAPDLSVRAIDMQSVTATELWHADDGTPLAWMQLHGQGRIALWRLTDSYRLTLAGYPAAYGSLWSDTLAQLSRASGAPAPTLPRSARVDERAVFCGLAKNATAGQENSAPTPLVIEPDGCAGFWPANAGWHSLQSADALWPFYVRSRDENMALLAGDTHRATLALVRGVSDATAFAVGTRAWARWPFLLGWLAVITGLWWLERGGVARRAGVPSELSAAA